MIKVRKAERADARRLLEIYDYYVRKTAITFEYDTPSLDEFTARMERIMKRYPYVVIEKDGCVEGYAYWYNMIWMEKIIGEHCVR